MSEYLQIRELGELPTNAEIAEFWKQQTPPMLDLGDVIVSFARMCPDLDGEVEVEFLNSWPRRRDKGSMRPHTWLEYELDYYGLDAFRAVDEDVLTASWMLQNGLAPEQLCLVEFYGRYFNSWTGNGYEYDSEHDVTVIWAEPLTDAEAGKAWDSWLSRLSEFDESGRA